MRREGAGRQPGRPGKRGVVLARRQSLTTYRPDVLSCLRAVLLYPDPGQQAFAFYESDDGVNAVARLDRTHDKWPIAAHAFGVFLHHLKRSTHIRGQVSFVDDEQVRLGDARPTLAWYFFAACNVNHI